MGRTRSSKKMQDKPANSQDSAVEQDPGPHSNMATGLNYVNKNECRVANDKTTIGKHPTKRKTTQKGPTSKPSAKKLKSKGSFEDSASQDMSFEEVEQSDDPPQAGTTHGVNFSEEDQIMTVEVTEPDNFGHSDFYDSEENDDNEVSFANTQSTEHSEGEVGDTSESDNDQAQPSTSTGATTNTQQKIQDIDDQVCQKLQELQELMQGNGLSRSAGQVTKASNAPVSPGNVNMNAMVKGPYPKRSQISSSESEATIYCPAVPKRVSSSSEDDNMDTSDETADNLQVTDTGVLISTIHKCSPIVDNARRRDRSRSISRDRTIRDRERADFRAERPLPLTPDQHADRVIREAESARARIFETPGKETIANNDYLQSVMMDDEFMLVGSHINKVTYAKIVDGKYVDFGKLIPHDKIAVEEDQWLEKVICGGRTYWVPPNESVSITNITCWDQAFRVFVNIYTKQFPYRAVELIEYNHIIHSISSVYVWDNVYSYDKDFRIHIRKNPNRSWSVILQHSWSL